MRLEKVDNLRCCMIAILIAVCLPILYVTQSADLRLLLGYLKIGRKVLYLSDGTSALAPSEPLCLLDFYTHSR